MLVVVKVLHVAFAAAWFGHKLLIPRDLDISLSEQSQADGLVRRMHIAERLGIGSGLGTVLTGVGLVFMTTGWSEVSVQIRIGLAAALSMFLVGGLVARRAWMRVKASVEQGVVRKAQEETVVFKRALFGSSHS
jgi:uncharacterized membrane protein